MEASGGGGIGSESRLQAAQDSPAPDRVNAELLTHDRKLLPGQDWDEEIRQALNWADVILFFVSPAFVESRYCREVEGRLAMDRLEFRAYAVRAA